jgi:hypothetical protein
MGLKLEQHGIRGGLTKVFGPNKEEVTEAEESCIIRNFVIILLTS